MSRVFDHPPTESTPPPLPSVAILHSDRLEARELADDLASMLDELLQTWADDALDVLEMLQRGEEALQRWHERSWADEVNR
jgi:hypothetical protein